MKKKGKLALEIIVHVRNEEIREFETELGHVKMIPFGGTIDCSLFHGICEPFGVDTQITNQAEVRHMSARYMLTGQDYTGAGCHIYIENNAFFTKGERPRPFQSVPTFYTDSRALAPYFHRNRFIGEGLREDDGLHIRFYELATIEDSSS